MSWVQDILDATDYIESPKKWLWWSIMSAISAVSSPNVYLDKFAYKLSPNLFVMLVGRSGLGKGFPVYLASELVNGVANTRVISGRNSIQAVISELSQSRSREGKELLTDSRGFLISEEFVNFLIDDKNTLSILTALYDTHYQKVWQNTLKSGKEKLKGVNLTMLAASNPAYLRQAIHAADIEGGFMARTLFIFADKPHRINSMITAPDNPFKIDKYVPYLTEISKLRGQFTYGKRADLLYDSWYKEFRSIEKEDRNGVAQRLHNNIEKLAQCISMGESLNLVIEEEHMQLAIDNCLEMLSNTTHIMQGAGGKSEIAEHCAMVLNLLAKSKDYELSRIKILQRLFGDVDGPTLTRVVETLEEAKNVEILLEEGKVYYRLSPEYVEALNEWIKSRKN